MLNPCMSGVRGVSTGVRGVIICVIGASTGVRGVSICLRCKYRSFSLS